MEWIRKNEMWWQALVTLFLTLAVLTFTPEAHPHGIPAVDSSVFGYVAMEMQRGGIPYIDTFDHKGPLIYLLNYLGALMGGWRSMIVFEAFAVAAMTFCLFRIARLRAGMFSSLIVVMVCTVLFRKYFLENGNYVEEYAMPCIALATFLFLRGFQRKVFSKKDLFLIGISLSMIVALRPNMAGVWAVGIPVTIWMLWYQGMLRQGFLWAFGGFLAGLAPFLAWLAACGALQACWNNYIVFSMTYSSAFEKYVTGRASVSETPLQAMYARYPAFLFFAKKGAWQAVLLGLLAIGWQRRWRDCAAWASIGMLLVSLLAVSMSGMMFNHYGMMLIPVLAYPFAMFLGALEQWQFREISVASWLIRIGSVIWLCVYLVTTARWYVHAVRHPVDDPYHQHAFAVVSYIEAHTDPDDSIIVIGNQDAIYLLSRRYASSRYSYQAPIAWIDKDIAREFWDDVNSGRAKIIVFYREMMEMTSADGIWNSERYRPVPEFMGRDDFRVYERVR